MSARPRRRGTRRSGRWPQAEGGAAGGAAARVEARAAAKTAAQSLLVEKAKTASNRAASLAGSRLAALRVRGLYHAWVLPHVHLCVWKSFEQWRRSVLALVASARLRKLGQVASTATGAPVSTLLDPHVTMASIGSASHQRTPVHGRRDSASSPSLALAAAHQRGGPKAHAAAVARSSIRPPNAATPRGGAGPRAMPPSTPGGGRRLCGGGRRRQDGEIRLAKAAAEQASQGEGEGSAAGEASEGAGGAGKGSGDCGLPAAQDTCAAAAQSLSAALARAALRWSLAAKARTLSHWRSVPIGDMGSAAGPRQRSPPSRRLSGANLGGGAGLPSPRGKRKLVPAARAAATHHPAKADGAAGYAPPQTSGRIAGRSPPRAIPGGAFGGIRYWRGSTHGPRQPLCAAAAAAAAAAALSEGGQVLGRARRRATTHLDDGHHATACQARTARQEAAARSDARARRQRERRVRGLALAGAADALEAAVTPDYTGAAKARESEGGRSGRRTASLPHG